MIKKAIISFIAITLIVCNVIVFAENTGIVPYASELIASCSVGIDNNGCTIIASPSITAIGTLDKVGFSSLRIEMYNGSSWVVKTTFPAKYNYGVSSYSNDFRYTGESGKKYRARCSFHVIDDGTPDYQTCTSKAITLP